MRQAVNEWIRQSDDGVIDFDAVVRDRNIRRTFGQNTMQATIYIRMMPGTKQWEFRGSEMLEGH